MVLSEESGALESFYFEAQRSSFERMLYNGAGFQGEPPIRRILRLIPQAQALCFCVRLRSPAERSL